MKKSIIAIILAVMLLMLCGCSDGKTEISSSDKQSTSNIKNSDILLLVLKNEKTFISKSSEGYLKNYKSIISDDYKFIPEKYTFTDLDGDKTPELIALSEQSYLILRKDNDKIYGYEITARGFADLKTDGTFIGSSGASFNDYLSISFDGTEYKTKELARYYYDVNNPESNELRINGKDVGLEEIEKFADDWSKKTSATWTDFEYKEEAENTEVTESQTAATVMLLGGYESYELYKEKIPESEFFSEYDFLGNLPKERFISSGDGIEAFAIIPSSDIKEVAVYELIYSSDLMSTSKGEELYKGDASPIVLKCNMSDLRPDSIVTLTYKSGNIIEFSPSTSLKDGSVHITSETSEKIEALN